MPGGSRAAVKIGLNLTHFNELGLAEPLLRAISAEGYTQSTPIQAKVIPAMLAGEDVLGTAQTGTGKTASFALPLLQVLVTHPMRPEPKRCRALVLAPTRELAAQIAKSIHTYGRNIRHSVALVIGGAKIGPQIKALSQGVDIVVATPGRLLDHLSTGAIYLDRTKNVVLDEGDQMLDLGFMPAIRKILAKLPADRQTVLLSATMPKQILALSREFLDSPREIAVTPAATPVERIEQRVIHVESRAKSSALVGVLSGEGVERAIVFTRTKRGADKVKTLLDKAGLPASAIHGNKSQSQREHTLASFRSGRARILVATDIAARGIDVPEVTHVINYELPNVPEAYVHRIGRTARAGKAGVAVSLCDPSERGLLRDIERLIGRLIRAEGDTSSPQRRLDVASDDKGDAKSPNAPRRQRRRSRKRNGNGKSFSSGRSANAGAGRVSERSGAAA